MENNNEKRIKLTWNKKVISISFLALALFMLLAVSYAYFTATVVGNEDAESITVEAAKMSLKLTGPTEVSLSNALPGTEVKSEFTVTNTGTVQTTYNLDMIDVTNTFVDKGDLVYSITSTHDGGHAENVVAPTTNQTLIRNILIQPGEKNAQEYTLTVRFRETGVDQNSNQGKKFTGRIQINNLEDKSLAATILRANPIQSSDGIDYKNASPWCKTETGRYDDCVWQSNGEGLFSDLDNEGTSYYYRGPVINNNVVFAEMNWKIVRINGDGSIRLIYSDRDGLNRSEYATSYGDYTDVGYTRYNAHDCTQSNPCVSDYDVDNGTFNYNYKNEETVDSPVKEGLENWYISNLATYDKQIALTTYCNDTSIISESYDNYDYYSGYSYSYAGGNAGRNKWDSPSPILTCPNPTNYESEQTHNYGGVYKLKIGLLTTDEGRFAGEDPAGDYGSRFFLNAIVSDWIVSMTPHIGYSMSEVVIVNNYTQKSVEAISGARAVPVINLNPDVTFTGTGTEDDPYTITNN